MRKFTIVLLLSLAACGEANVSTGGSVSPPTSSNPSATPIFDVQGRGERSPLVGQNVIIEGIVTGDFQEDDADRSRGLGGFYMQQHAGDGDDRTSDGIFVFDGGSPDVDVNVGDRVEVAGEVKEFFGETQLAAVSVAIIGSGSVEPVEVLLPVATVTTNSNGDTIADLEHLEGMLVRFPQALTVGQLFELESYGSIGLTQGGRAYQFTNRNAPDRRDYAKHRENTAARTILLDDGRRDRGVTPIRLLHAGASPDYSIRTGDEITNVTGVFRYSRGSGNQGIETYRLMPVVDPEFESTNPRPGPPQLDGTLRVASFNALNLFATVDNGADVCGPRSNDGCRGADSNAERDRQIGKLATAIRQSGADIVGLMEIENDGGDSLRVLVAELNSGGANYEYVNTGTVGGDVITTGFVFDRTTVLPVGDAAVLDADVDHRFNDRRNRPALAQSFEQRSNGARINIVVNHFKSKGSSCDADGDPNRNDGQANCNSVRTLAAEALADWVATDPTESGDNDYLIIGDLNAYLLEDPLAALKDGGLTSLLESRLGTDAWSFVFDGQSGALDHALSTTSLTLQIADVMEWHINADEPPLLDYNLEGGRNPTWFDESTPYRASDHDPVLIGINLTP
ncbi:MAG: ExeM/NucH family extracellular endonuclease [Pseudomonadota bacterium]